MTDQRAVRGRWGERLAARCLTRQGLRIIEHNWSVPLGEIDIVARDGDTLVFVEVRTRNSAGPVAPEETIDRRKRNKLIALAKLYLACHQLDQTPVRFDLVAVRYGGLGLRGQCAYYPGVIEVDQ